MNRRRAVAGVALVLGALPLMGTAPVADLDVTLTKVRSAKGMMRICLTSDPANFPRCVDDRNAIRLSIPASQHSISFPALPGGRYAVAVIHDENGNAKLDTMMGIPREGFGFSRNPPVRFGPPRFETARFSFESGAQAQQIRLRYIL